MQALVLGFCSSGYNFAIPSSRLHLTIQTLGITMRFAGNYALSGLSPQIDNMPVILKKVVMVLISMPPLGVRYLNKLLYGTENLTLHKRESFSITLSIPSAHNLPFSPRVAHVREVP